MNRITRLVALIAIASLIGCQANAITTNDATEMRPIKPALISHPVFFTLTDPNDVDELIRDCDALLTTIPSVAAYACGTPHDTGRETVDLNFHVGLYVGFDSDEDYAAYVVHPNHVELVQKWRPRLATLRVHDVIDQ